MKNSTYWFILLLFFLSCKKDEYDEITVSGFVIDSYTQKNASGMEIGTLTVGKPYLSYGWYDVDIVYPIYYQGRCVVDQNGHFEFRVPAGSTYYLASDDLNSRYHKHALINGNEAALYYTSINPRDTLGSYVKFDKSIDFSIEVSPKPLCRFDFPPIPEAWKTYGISIGSNVWDAYIYNLSNESGLDKIKQMIFSVEDSDQHAKGYYAVYDDSNIQFKKEFFDVYCSLEKTTVILLKW